MIAFDFESLGVGTVELVLFGIIVFASRTIFTTNPDLPDFSMTLSIRLKYLGFDILIAFPWLWKMCHFSRNILELYPAFTNDLNSPIRQDFTCRELSKRLAQEDLRYWLFISTHQSFVIASSPKARLCASLVTLLISQSLNSS